MSVPILVKIGQVIRPWECSQTDGHTDWQTQTNFVVYSIVCPMLYAIAMGHKNMVWVSNMACVSVDRSRCHTHGVSFSYTDSIGIYRVIQKVSHVLASLSCKLSINRTKCSNIKHKVLSSKRCFSHWLILCFQCRIFCVTLPGSCVISVAVAHDGNYKRRSLIYTVHKQQKYLTIK